MFPVSNKTEQSSGLRGGVVCQKFTDASEKCTTSIFRDEESKLKTGKYILLKTKGEHPVDYVASYARRYFSSGPVSHSQP
jgi:hypothetical protein